jgi:hypothetical protein
MLGTTSIARVTTNTHRAKAASTLTATLFMVYPLSSRSTSSRRQNERSQQTHDAQHAYDRKGHAQDPVVGEHTRHPHEPGEGERDDEVGDERVAGEQSLDAPAGSSRLYGSGGGPGKTPLSRARLDSSAVL